MTFTASDVLLKAASRVEEEGMWCQGLLFERQARCALSHLLKTALDLNGAYGQYYEAYRRLSRLVGPVGVWNDTPGRTAHEVAEAMRQAALR